MKVELESAVNFIISMLRAGHRAQSVRSKGDKFFLETELEMLQVSLITVMSRQYKDFWFPESPNRGSAYRCIRINKDKMDPVIARAAASCGLSCNLIRAYLPDELTMWVDPSEVSYRIGEEDGSICVLYEAPVAVAVSVPSRYESSSSSSSLSSSASTSPGYSSSSSPPFNGRHHIQQQQRQQQQQQQLLQQQQQQQQQQVSADGGNNNSNSYSPYSSPVKPSANLVTFVPSTYGSPMHFVHSPYNNFASFLSS